MTDQEKMNELRNRAVDAFCDRKPIVMTRDELKLVVALNQLSSPLSSGATGNPAEFLNQPIVIEG